MTIAEEIESEIATLSPMQQRALLAFLHTLKSSTADHGTARNARDRKAEVKAAVRGIAGMWKDRADLPKDPVQAVKVLRARMGFRGRHG